MMKIETAWWAGPPFLLGMALVWTAVAREPFRGVDVAGPEAMRPVPSAPASYIPVVLLPLRSGFDSDAPGRFERSRYGDLWQMPPEQRLTGSAGGQGSVPQVPVVPQMRQQPRSRNWMDDHALKRDDGWSLSADAVSGGWLRDNMDALRDAAERRRGPEGSDAAAGFQDDLLLPDEFRVSPLPRNPLLEE